MSVDDITSETPFEKSDSPHPFLIGNELWITLRLGLGLCFHFPFSVLGFCFVWVCAGFFCAFMVSVSSHVHHFCCAWKTFSLESSTASGSSNLFLHIVQLWISFNSNLLDEDWVMFCSMDITIHHQESFYCCSFGRIIVVGFSLGTWSILSQVLGQFSSIMCGLHLMMWALNPIRSGWLVP